MKRFLAFLIVAMTVLGLSAQTKKAVVAYFSATSGGSGIEQSVSELKTTYPSVKWQKGMLKN